MITTLLGGMTPRQFLQEYWQKKPLLVRQAVPGFTGVLGREDIFDLACDPDVESRHIRLHEGNWELNRGPQTRARLRGKRSPWTVLVQGINLWSEAADELLHRFNFIPQARLDDLMVSYAVDGGGVGPHFDNYDVFLLQGQGQRRWQIADQDDRSLVEGAPLRILRNFVPAHDWILEPGDMLYLPPHWAHNGIAIGECTTYSIGFRSPTAQELGAEFLGWLQERVCLDGLYSDPDLTEQDNSALIGDAMIDQVQRVIEGIRWSRADVAAFLGHYLTEPKPTVFFEPPEEPIPLKAFRRALGAGGLRLDARTLLLRSQGNFFLNGEAVDSVPAWQQALDTLAHARRLTGCADLPAALQDLFYEWYCDGFAHPM
ncbi:cupin domain-containing protein [Azoarcus olearius]|uniref:JmjC domain-containing protein n=1 Tax=Azoarcus sp. (strain BH72) TaxID=418699 RepID=A1K4G1_AZOSB|nr:cupin domain-containing protein [Azoarcus olearius]CAL93716.1 conserved hypothetical protein [Azoarcus olearius]